MSVTLFRITAPATKADAIRTQIAAILAEHDLPHALEAFEIPGDDDILAKTREMLTTQGVDPANVKTLTFGTEEWDNGYFFTHSPTITYIEGYDGDEPDGYFEDLAGALLELRGGTLGDHDEAVIHLDTNTVNVD